MSQREFVALGTASQAPTRERNHNGYFLRWDEEGFLFLVGRLKPGVSIGQANADLESMLTQWPALSGNKHSPDTKNHRMQMEPLQGDLVGGISAALWVLQGAVGFVLGPELEAFESDFAAACGAGFDSDATASAIELPWIQSPHKTTKNCTPAPARKLPASFSANLDASTGDGVVRLREDHPRFGDEHPSCLGELNLPFRPVEEFDAELLFELPLAVDGAEQLAFQQIARHDLLGAGRQYNAAAQIRRRDVEQRLPNRGHSGDYVALRLWRQRLKKREALRKRGGAQGPDLVRRERARHIDGARGGRAGSSGS